MTISSQVKDLPRQTMPPIDCTPQVSVVIPIYNGKHLLDQLFADLQELRKTPAGKDYEIIVVDDGSNDKSREILIEKINSLDQATLLILDGNHGQHTALKAGCDIAKGRYLQFMSDDLSRNAVQIPEFVDTVAKGSDLVIGYRSSRPTSNGLRLYGSRQFQRLLTRLTGSSLNDPGCMFLCYRREVLGPGENHLKLFAKLPHLLCREIPLDTPEHGHTRYSYLTLFALAFRLLRGMYTDVPLPYRIAGHHHSGPKP